MGSVTITANATSLTKRLDNKSRRSATEAPSTFRIPISFVRWAMVSDTRPNSPRQEMKIERPEKTPSSVDSRSSEAPVLPDEKSGSQSQPQATNGYRRGRLMPEQVTEGDFEVVSEHSRFYSVRKASTGFARAVFQVCSTMIVADIASKSTTGPAITHPSSVVAYAKLSRYSLP